MPPTTGIGPGIERMVMIFTGQENIDDVIFFPMMRAAISPLNATIYGVQESSLAPLEDLVLSVEDFESLCADGVLKPHARNLTVRPHLRLFGAAGRVRACGHVDIEGFLSNSVLRLAGYKIKAEPEQEGKVAELVERSLVKFLRQTFPECEVTVSPATILKHG